MQLTLTRGRAQAGFSMIEVLVTVVVIAIGLLGVAKMQAASVSNTQVARTRSLVALQASSLASMMHGNRGYWGGTSAPTSLTLSGAGSTSPCTTSAPCITPTAMANGDILLWKAGIFAQIPTYNATVACTPTATPVTCLITLTWTEKTVAINTSTAAAAAQQTSAPFTLLVTP